MCHARTNAYEYFPGVTGVSWVWRELGNSGCGVPQAWLDPNPNPSSSPSPSPNPNPNPQAWLADLERAAAGGPPAMKPVPQGALHTCILYTPPMYTLGPALPPRVHCRVPSSGRAQRVAPLRESCASSSWTRASWALPCPDRGALQVLQRAGNS